MSPGLVGKGGPGTEPAVNTDEMLDFTAKAEPSDERNRMNKIGFNLLMWTPQLSNELYPMIERLKTIGYDGIEVSLGNRDPAAYASLRDLLTSLDLGVTTVNAPSPDVNPISPDPAVRQRAIDHLREDIDLTHAAGGQILCGPLHSAFATFSNAAPTEQELDWSAEVLRAVADHAENAGVTLAIEALNRFECYLCNTAEQLKRLCDKVNHPRIKAMFDTHHANIEEQSLPDALERLSDHLVHVHISENDRGTPGAGHIAFDEVFQKLKNMDYKGWFTIESFSRSDVAFANAINVWREYAPAWDVAEKGYQMIHDQVKGGSQ